jgi:hypothetical protein
MKCLSTTAALVLCLFTATACNATGRLASSNSTPTPVPLSSPPSRSTVVALIQSEKTVLTASWSRGRYPKAETRSTTN